MTDVYAEAATRTVPMGTSEGQDALYGLAALIPHPHLPGAHGCKSCAMEPGAAIHHWDVR